MKSNKISLSTIILIVAVLAIIAYSLISSIALKPNVTEAKFPFTITYEYKGEQVTINDVYTAWYTGNSGYADTKTRCYVGQIGDKGLNDTTYVLQEGKSGKLVLYTYFYPDYLMGEEEYEYFDEETPFAPKFAYYNAVYEEFIDEETLTEKGVKLISFEYPTPIENSFSFSHISYFSAEIVIPGVLIALLALLAIAIFEKKDNLSRFTVVNTVSVVLNFVICLTLLPFLTVAGALIDINGGGSELERQIFYFLPSLIVLCVAASVALRRKGSATKSLVVQIAGVAVFVTYIIVCTALGLL